MEDLHSRKVPDLQNIRKEVCSMPKTEIENNVIRPKRHSRDVFHAWMLEGAEYVGPRDMIRLRPCQAIPNKLVAFSDAMKPGWKDFDCWVHFFEDDVILEPFWKNPKRYLNKLKKFRGVCGLDYSVGWNFPIPIKEHNHFRNSVCSFWLSRQGVRVIPQARCEQDDYTEVLAGFPKHSTIAIGARAMVRDVQDRIVLKESVKLIVDYLQPSHIVWYGSTRYGVTDYLDKMRVPYTVYPGKGRGSLSSPSRNEGVV